MTLNTFDASTVPPDFRDSERPGNLSVVLSQPISLLCDVTGSPTPVVTWYKDGNPVSGIQLKKVLTFFPSYFVVFASLQK